MITSTARPAVDSPSSLRHIPHRFRNDDADRSALELIEALDGDWKTAAGPVELLRFTDGITNTLLKATKRRPGRSEAEVDEEAVLIRAYGEGTAVLIDRERELRAHSRLATLGFAPPLLATFDNGIMYRFIRGSVCTPEMLDAELDWVSTKLGGTPGLDGKDYIFGHCDLLSGNVIVQNLSDSNLKPSNGHAEDIVRFIDYEYATPSPAAFDIANHFAEWAGFECDHGAVPTKSQRMDFLKASPHYVGSFRYHSISENDTQAIDVDLREDVEQLYEQVDMFRGVPGFYWGIWALIQATISQIDFDYASYAELRLGEYWAWKAELDGSRKGEGRDAPLRERRWAEE
ncbi:hypothetical protein LTR91_014520 [Friedmanniomyces endolithicus]|uniref:ethanolamine kinase n=1 Tax=Friedmanniomyces endolithicus TaxID=329885 RepID=A0A4U0UAS6_9PEZI|nr:hypothetical protein LTS09_016050 [Friedmanniomyces endolithicus]KAK0303573.1 hypothetical protein LTR01_007906 [Friedmanniomyces endolithicus]KAK0823632.1 hypothetical protein LTR73_008325 [Friedmanniomyces endolithicus]KAK0911008.1 hypothetical protein LTR57_015543 [Friedmanniomyces endolithicus]KAK0934364.1 hypothetical protein LTR29_014026 [Friedmanniomyces endolithicus]